MTAPIDNSFSADPQGLTALRRDAQTQSPESLRAVARQFESLFTQMMLKGMRSATPQDPLFGSDQQEFYQDMFDSGAAGLRRGRRRGRPRLRGPPSRRRHPRRPRHPRLP